MHVYMYDLYIYTYISLIYTRKLMQHCKINYTSMKHFKYLKKRIYAS